MGGASWDRSEGSLDRSLRLDATGWEDGSVLQEKELPHRIFDALEGRQQAEEFEETNFL